MQDFEGRDDGFEDTEASERDENLGLKAKDFANLVVAPADWTIGTLHSQIGQQIDLDPAFQRRNVWSPSAKSSFIESLFLGIPIPQILLSSKQKQRSSFLVLDGKQRLLTIKEFMDGTLPDGKAFKLNKLRVLKELEGKCWSDLEEDPSWSKHLLNHTLRTAVIRNWDDEPVLYEIFFRLNSGSVKLSPMELRMSLHPGEFLKFIIQWSERVGPLHQLLSKKGPDPRMNDVELAVRYLSFSDPEFTYGGNLKEHLDNYCIGLNKRFVEDPAEIDRVKEKLAAMEKAIKLGLDVFEQKNFCRKFIDGGYENRFNRAIFDIQVGSLSQTVLADAVKGHKDKFKRVFEVVSGDIDFRRSVETTTNSVTATRERFDKFYSAIRHRFDVKLVAPRIAA